MKFEIYLSGFDVEDPGTWDNNRFLVEANTPEQVDTFCKRAFDRDYSFQQVDTDLGGLILDDYVTKNTPLYELRVETDDDFSVMFQGKVYFDHEFTIPINSINELDEIEILGVYGTPFNARVKCQEFQEGIERIKANPGDSFDSTGGNRGVEWIVNDQELKITFYRFNNEDMNCAWDNFPDEGCNEIALEKQFRAELVEALGKSALKIDIQMIYHPDKEHMLVNATSKTKNITELSSEIQRVCFDEGGMTGEFNCGDSFFDLKHF